MVERIVATQEALKLIDFLIKKHGPIMFHQSGGCCDGSAAMCYPEGDLSVGGQDILLGEIGGTPFYMHKNQYDYWKHTQLILDAVEGMGGIFSLESVEGKRFVIKLRTFTFEELQELEK